MSLTKEAIVEKWLTCKHSVEWGFKGEDGHALADEGIRQNHGCEHPEIISSGRFPEGSFFESGEEVKVARLHIPNPYELPAPYGTNKDDDPLVIASLTSACGNCPFYEKLQK